MSLDYVSNAQLLRDVAAWEQRLPAFDAFVGVPRGGMIPATLLACHRNVPLLSLEHLLAYGPESLAVPLVYASGVTAARPTPLRVLVVDDNAGKDANTFLRIRGKLSKYQPRQLAVALGLVYRNERSPVDYWYKDNSCPIFEYDYHRRFYVRHIGFELDGVICEDYTATTGDAFDDADPLYVKHLSDAACLLKPRDPVAAIVSSRLEQHRKVTEDWLARHGVRYKELLLFPDIQGRRSYTEMFRHKAEFLRRPDIWFFVESEPEQAHRIHVATGKPVLLSQTGELLE